jgi:hypothetical protein
LPPDPCIQFSPQPLLSAVTSNALVEWQGQFSERLQNSPAAASTGATAATSAWLVNVVYSLHQELTPSPVPVVVVKGGDSFYVTGTATETLTPLNASGNPIAAGQVWVSTDSIQSQVTVAPSMAANAVANSFTFSTDTTVTQTIKPVVAVASTAPTAPSWIANTTNTTTGTLVEAPSYLSGTISLNEQIKQTLAPVTATVAGPVWTVSAQFVGSGDFQETRATATSTLTSAMPGGTLDVAGTLTGTISPPSGSLSPTEKLDSKVTASVVFSPTLLPVPVLANGGLAVSVTIAPKVNSVPVSEVT